MSFKIWKLIESRFLEDFSQADEHLICDIDKTYLETAFESFVQMAQIPFEKAREKVTVLGAKELLQAYRHRLLGTRARPLHFVSASPPQLRKVLSEKLHQDGLTWSSDTFKNQGYNLRQGRLSQLKNQVAFKSTAILNILLHSNAQSHFLMLGDNAESDPMIYLGIKLFVENRLSRMGYLQYLRIFGVPRLESLQLLRYIKAPRAHVDAILIRKLAHSKFTEMKPLTDPILYFDNFFEPALYFFQEKILDTEYLNEFCKIFHSYYGINTPQMKEYLNLFSQTSNSHDLLKIIERVREELPTDVFNEEIKSVHLIEKKNLDAFDALKEEDILKLAKEWKKTLRKT